MNRIFNSSAVLDSFQNYFPELSHECISKIIKCGKEKHYEAGEIIIHQGELTDDVYFLLFGRVSVSVSNDAGEEYTVNEISNGEFFGEMSHLTGEPRSTTLITSKESVVYQVSSSDFKILLNEHMSLMQYLNSLLIKRLTHSNISKSVKHFQSVSLVPLTQEGRVDNLITELTQLLSLHQKTFHVTKEKARSIGILNDMDSVVDKYKFLSWIHDLQFSYTCLIFVCDQADLAWSELCLRHADRIMLIGYQGYQVLTPIEQEILMNRSVAKKIEKNLVLLHETNTPIKGTLAHKNLRKVKNVFHVYNDRDIKRVARYMLGQSIKLVLGGGGAKGYAHLGVFKAMLELDIPIDFIGGTSVGSVMGAAIATGWSYDKISSSVFEVFVKNNPLKSYQVPIVSILDDKKLCDALDHYFGEFDIEDLVIPFYAIAANFSESCVEVLDSGSLSFAVRASISLPAMLPPVVKDNCLLVDGGLIDNLPLDHMNTLAVGPTIGVDLSVSKKRDLGYEKIPSNSVLLKQKFYKTKKYKVPSIAQIILGTMTIASNEKRIKNERYFDIYIKPDLTKFSFLGWKKFDEMVQLGYDVALPILKDWKEKKSSQLVL